MRGELSITEVPSFEAERIWGTSNLRTISDGMRVLRSICAEWRHVASTASATVGWSPPRSRHRSRRARDRSKRRGRVMSAPWSCPVDEIVLDEIVLDESDDEHDMMVDELAR